MSQLWTTTPRPSSLAAWSSSGRTAGRGGNRGLAERERAEDRSGEDAAWRELVARFDLPSPRPDGTAPPWPEREDLPAPRHQSRHGTAADASTAADAGAAADPSTAAEASTAGAPDTGAGPGEGSAPGAGSGPGDGPDSGRAAGPGAADDPGKGDQVTADQASPAEPAIPDRTRGVKPDRKSV